MKPKDKPAEQPPQQETPPAPNYVTKDELTALSTAVQNLTSQFGQIGGRIDVLASERSRSNDPAPTPAPTFQRTITLDMIDAAHDEGDFKKASRLQAQFTAETLKESQIAMQQQLTALQHNGMNMIASVVGTQATAKLPHYTRFKSEIDEFLGKLDPAIRANPEAHEWAHNSVVGKHHAELLKEAEEAAVRKFMDGGADAMPNGQPPKKSDGDLTMESVYGGDAPAIKDFLRRQGRTLEQHAKMNKHPDVQSYLKFVKTQREHLEAANG